jgi:hypothetical protein
MNLAVAISNFSGSRHRAFAKTGGGVAMRVNVVLDPVSGVRNYITYAEDSGKFCKQSFDICRPIWEFA